MACHGQMCALVSGVAWASALGVALEDILVKRVKCGGFLSPPEPWFLHVAAGVL